MATKKTATTTKRKTVKKSAPAAKKTSTRVTTVRSASASAGASRRFSFMRAPLLASSVAEFIGTFLLAAVVLAASGQPLFVMFGLLAIVLLVSGLSGAHLNPALTVGALVTRRITAVRALSYVVAQVLGAILALVVLNAFVSAAPAVSEQAQAFGQAAPTVFNAPAVASGKEWVVLAAELLGSVILAFAVAAGLRRGRSKVEHALLYSGGLYVAILVAGTAANYVGASAVMNPAVAGSLQALEFSVWPLVIYVLTPLVGAVLGFALHDVVQTENDTVASAK
ncbi:MAG TPA: aquaporin [Candidatus Saccharibacteria bacterium]|nr:aquaporin [Candidatus Saccharibacteria bacterium]HRK94454.1 aquaporin [Candidatus Saccharibacteria bacterium]